MPLSVPAWRDPTRLHAGEDQPGDDRLVAVAPNEQAAVAARDGHHRRLHRQRTPARREPGHVGPDRLGHQIFGALEVSVRHATVVEPTAGQHVVTKRLIAQHLHDTVVDAAALAVPGRREPVPVGGVVADQGVQQRRLGLIHSRGITQKIAGPSTVGAFTCRRYAA